MKELPLVLWALCTTLSRAIGQTLFSLVVDVSYAALQVHVIVNIHFIGCIFQVSYLFNPMGSSNSIMSKMYTRITLVGTINPNRGYVKRI
jgi:hypothetical protein